MERNQLRIIGLNKQHNMNQNITYSFSALFSANEKTRNDIQFSYMEFLKKVEKLVKNAKEEHCYQMNFDLFPWTRN